jgi:putative ABC transport system permease protein
MIKNYLKSATRNLMKYKLVSAINLLGLAMGLSCCLLILTYILNELSYDRYNANLDRVYRVTRTFYNTEGAVSLTLSTVAPPYGPLLQNEFPDIQKVTRLLNNGPTPFRYKEKTFNEDQVYFADENLSDVLTVQWIRGNAKEGLRDPYCVMLTDEIAKKYFGDADPLNQQIRFNNQFDFKVTGIYKPFPRNAHMHPSILLSFNTLRDTAVYGAENLRTDWGNNSFFTFLRMPENYRVDHMIAQFPAFLDKYMNRNDFNGKAPSKFTRLGLQPLKDIHLYSHTDYEAEENGDIKRVYIFSAIALFILLIACINYMNLSTARSALRAREIGIRKVVGARKRELIAQFLNESVLISWAASILALGALGLGIPWLNKVTGLELSIQILLGWKVLLGIFLMPFVVGIISGIYPAFFMSSFQPVKTLKGLFKAAGSNISFRRVLVIVQFSISIILTIATAIVFQQLQYMQKKSLGYDKEHILTLTYPGSLSPSYDAYRTELLKSSFIRDASRSSRIPTGRLLDDMGAYTYVGDSLQPSKADIKYVATDYDFIPTYGIRLVAGRNFSRSFGTDTSNFVLNESAVSILGWHSPEQAIGQRFKYGGKLGQIIGVTGDFHFESLHQKISPMIFILPTSAQSGFYNYLSVKIAGDHVPAALARVENTWKKFLPETPYRYSFLDERFAGLYQSELRQGTLFTAFAGIAILIACLGLFGLSAFAVSQRIKEIGVRKVLGAPAGSLVRLLTGDFLRLVAFAALIAFPIAWFSMHEWLQDFAYRVAIQWWVFLLAGFLALLVALLTVSLITVRAANSNPVKSLRTE